MNKNSALLPAKSILIFTLPQSKIKHAWKISSGMHGAYYGAAETIKIDLGKTECVCYNCLHLCVSISTLFLASWRPHILPLSAMAMTLRALAKKNR